MDLRSAAEAIRSHRRVAYVGVGLAFLLSILAFAKPVADFPPLEQREPVKYESAVRLFITQPGFPWGRIVVFEEQDAASGGEPVQRDDRPRFGDPDRFADLAILYSHLAESDAVRRLMERDGPVEGEIMGEPIASDDGDGLPLVGITAMAASPEGAVTLAQRQIAAFSTFIAAEQRRNEIPDDDRVIIEQVDQPRAAELEVPRKKTEPIAIFMAVMIATLGSAFVLENLRSGTKTPRGREYLTDDDARRLVHAADDPLWEAPRRDGDSSGDVPEAVPAASALRRTA